MVWIKGQVTTVAIALIFSLGTAGFLGIIYSGEPVEESVQIYNSDFNALAEAKLKKDAYKERTKKELNYSTNIVALELGEKMGSSTSSSIDWSSGIPSFSDLKSEYLKVSESELKFQNGVIDCSSPQIEELSGEIPQTYTVEVDEGSITCETRQINGIIPSKATVNLTDSNFEVLNSDNRYLSLAKYSVGFANRISSELSSRSSKTATGSASISCSVSGSTSSVETSAKINARNNVEEKLPNLNKSLFDSDSGERSSWIGLDSSSRSLEGTIKEGSVSSSSSSCDYDCDSDGDGDIEEDGCSGKEYSGSATAFVDSATLEYKLKDSNRKVINSTGDQETIEFYFKKKFNYASD